jgi:PAS domain S-box-containing protein
MSLSRADFSSRWNEDSLSRAPQESDERFRLLVDSVQDYAIFLLDPEGRVVSWNSGAQAIKGYSEDEIIGHSFEVFYPAEARRDGRALQILQAARRDGRYAEQGERIRKDGTRFWADIVITALYDAEGQLTGFAKVTRDISQRKRAEQALRESETRFRTLADHLSQLVWMADGTGYIFWYNRRWYEYTGTTLEQMRGWGWKAVHHPEHVERVARRWQHSYETGESWEDTFPLRGKDGLYRWFLSRAVPIRDEHGKIVFWFGSNTDITEQIEATDALSESERRLRFALRSSRIGDWDLDLASGRVSGSLEHFQALGHSALLEDWSVGKFLEQVHPEDRADVEHRIRASLASNQELHYEGRVIWPDQSLHWVEVHAAFRDDPGTDSYHLTGIVQDITARKRSEAEVQRLANTLEERVQERTRQLADANLELQSFNYTVSHDLRAPLRGIRGFAAALQEDFGDRLGAEGHEYCERITSAGARMEQLIEDLLAYGRLSRQDLSLKSVELENLVDEVLTQIGRPGEIEVDQPLPVVLGHRPLLHQVLHNLIANALKFVAPGATPRVRIHGRKLDGMARIFVDDNGIGIAPEHVDRIFRVFERLHGDEAYPGTGIGLAIVRRAMERLGGRAGVEPLPAGGSRFWIELPAP